MLCKWLTSRTWPNIPEAHESATQSCVLCGSMIFALERSVVKNLHWWFTSNFAIISKCDGINPNVRQRHFLSPCATGGQEMQCFSAMLHRVLLIVCWNLFPANLAYIGLRRFALISCTAKLCITWMATTVFLTPSDRPHLIQLLSTTDFFVNSTAKHSSAGS